MNLTDLHPPRAAVREAVERALREDLLPLGDITASLMPPGVKATARFVANGDGVLAGCLCAEEVFNQVDSAIKVDWKADDGTDLTDGDEIAALSGPLASLLAGNRIALNFLTTLSGISSLTRRYVRAGQNKLVIRSTRHTVPGFRSLSSAAVRAGGGVNRRGSLSDSVLLHKEYLQAVSISDAVRRARMRQPGHLIQVECSDRDQVREAIDCDADLILVNDVTPDEAKDFVAEAGGKKPIEVAGDIELQQVRGYIDAGVDMLAVHQITASAPILDISFELLTPNAG